MWPKKTVIRLSDGTGNWVGESSRRIRRTRRSGSMKRDHQLLQTSDAVLLSLKLSMPLFSCPSQQTHQGQQAVQ